MHWWVIKSEYCLSQCNDHHFLNFKKERGWNFFREHGNIGSMDSSLRMLFLQSENKHSLCKGNLGLSKEKYVNSDLSLLLGKNMRESTRGIIFGRKICAGKNTKSFLAISGLYHVEDLFTFRLTVSTEHESMRQEARQTNPRVVTFLSYAQSCCF